MTPSCSSASTRQGNALSFSTYYGGTGSDLANVIVADSSGNMFRGRPDQLLGPPARRRDSVFQHRRQHGMGSANRPDGSAGGGSFGRFGLTGLGFWEYSYAHRSVPRTPPERSRLTSAAVLLNTTKRPLKALAGVTHTLLRPVRRSRQQSVHLERSGEFRRHVRQHPNRHDLLAFSGPALPVRKQSTSMRRMRIPTPDGWRGGPGTSPSRPLSPPPTPCRPMAAWAPARRSPSSSPIRRIR